MDIEKLYTKIEKLESNIHKLEVNIATVSTKLEALTVVLEKYNNSHTKIEANIQAGHEMILEDRKKIDDHEKRMQALESTKAQDKRILSSLRGDNEEDSYPVIKSKVIEFETQMKLLIRVIMFLGIPATLSLLTNLINFFGK
jgi:septal ring factor EnvC (AmiA/AmiB activator)